jgi:hypothetical protein
MDEHLAQARLVVDDETVPLGNRLDRLSTITVRARAHPVFAVL